MGTQAIKFLVHGIDTLVCAYYLAPSGKPAINFERLSEQREILRQAKAKKPALVSIAGVDFLLHPRGTPSGYPLLLEKTI